MLGVLVHLHRFCRVESEQKAKGMMAQGDLLQPNAKPPSSLRKKRPQCTSYSDDTFREIRYMLDETGRVNKRYERLEEDAVYTGDMPYSWTEYSYDANGNVTKVVLPGGGIITYTYDNDDRVISETHEEKQDMLYL